MRQISYLIGQNPKNLKRLLKACHKKENEAMEEKEKAKLALSKSAKLAAVSSASSSTKGAKRKITDMFGNCKQKYSAYSAGHISRKQTLARFVAKTGVSTSLVSNDCNVS